MKDITDQSTFFSNFFLIRSSRMTNLTSYHDVYGTIVNSRFLTDKVMYKLKPAQLNGFSFLLKGEGTFSVYT